MSGSNDLLTFNGINGATGEYDVPPTPVDVIAELARGETFGKQTLEELRRRRQRDSESRFPFVVPENLEPVSEGIPQVVRSTGRDAIDPKNLGETGWGVIFAFGADPAIYEALTPLLALRQQQANAKREGLYREFRDADAYRPGETKLDFLNRHGVGPGPVDPEAMPYYLLIVGDPDTIPFRFQYLLDVQFAVGRIHFETVAEYAAYARSVVEAETGRLALARRAAFFAVANERDEATKLSHDELAIPLAAWVADPKQNKYGWAVDSYFGEAATKARLASLLGEDAPAFIFTASHGVSYSNGDVRQIANQGALLCQDWPGPSFRGTLPDGFFYTGDDLAADAKIFGTIAMHFGSFGTGTPMISNLTASAQPETIASQSFLGRLPQRMLAHPRGGALAVIGNIGRAWGCSFHWDRTESQTWIFKSTIRRLMEGHPVGSAMEYFSGRFAELSSDLSIQLEDAKYGANVDPYLLAGLWTANNDARGYSVIGDPAVRLQLVKDSQPVDRPILEVISGNERQLRPGYSSDTTSNHPDDLDVAVDVQTLCSVILARDVEPPLSIGLFGDWGTGKTFFMDRMYAEIERMAGLAIADAPDHFHSRVAQIKFNAWHYIDANLWASLVNHIIEDLAGQVKPKDPNPEEVRRVLLSNLETAKELKAEIAEEKKSAEQIRSLAESKLGKIAKERIDKQVKLSDLRAADFWRLAKEDKELKAELDSLAGELGIVADQLGIPSVMVNLEDLDRTLKDAHSTMGRAKAIGMAIIGHGSGAVVIVLILFLLIAVPAAVWLLRQQFHLPPFLISASAVLAELAAAVAAIARVARGPLKKVNEALTRLDSLRRRAQEVIDAKRKERDAQELTLEKQVNELRAKEESATHQLTIAEAKVQEIETKIREIDEGKSMAKYLLQRISAEDYRKHLGLVSTIRRDFENLSSLLEEAARRVDTEPIQRIVLYVDDLDRCPAATVMEVLQAVHLLLAFKLFVVVVGVDPRWLLHSLEKSYSAFEPRGDVANEWITTPQNYLEKIFQIPFSLQPMRAAGFSRLMHTLLPPTVSDQQGGVLTRHFGESQTTINTESAVETAGLPVQELPRALHDAETGAPEDRASTANSASGSSRKLDAVAVISRARLDYDAMRIQPWESEFAAALFRFMPSPRAAKRFSNIYRLLKAPLHGDSLRLFEGTSLKPGEFRSAMLLLAILTGFPASADPVFRKILAKNLTTAVPKEFFADSSYCGVISSDLSRFSTCMNQFLSDGLPETMGPLIKWAPKVARFSFESAKVAIDT